MNIKVTGHSPQQPPTTGKATKQDVSAQVGRQPSEQTQTAKDTIKLSVSGSVLQRAHATIDRTPVVDVQQVNNLHKAISSGNYHVDANRVAEKLIQFERNLG